MGRKRLDPEKRKETITIRLPKELIDKLRQIKGYNKIIEQLLNEYFK